MPGISTGVALGVAGLSATGAALSAGGQQGSQAGLMNIPPPAPQYPGLNTAFQQFVGPQAGGLTETSFGSLQQFAETGLPTDVGPAFEALVASRERFTQEGRSDIAEMFGASGARYGSDLMRNLVDFQSQVTADYGRILSDYTFRAQESARGRQLGAATYGADLFSTAAQTLHPTAIPTVTGGGVSTAGQIGAGLQQGSQGMMMLMLLRQMGMLGGGQQTEQQPTGG